MTRLTAITATGLAGVALLLAGCGGGGGGRDGNEGDAAVDAQAAGGGDVGEATACLIEANWILAPGDNIIEGTTELGVPFKVQYYPSPEDAEKNKAKGEVVGRTVVTYSEVGREQFTEDVKVSPKEKKVLAGCITGETAAAE